MSERAKQIRYERVLAGSSRKNETRDCSVIAVAMAARLPYDEAHALLCQYGRTSRQGVYPSCITGALGSLGYRVTRTTPEQKNGSKFTITTIGRHLKRGYYIVFVSGHFAALVNGEIYDWSRGSRKRVHTVYKIEKVRS